MSRLGIPATDEETEVIELAYDGTTAAGNPEINPYLHGEGRDFCIDPTCDCKEDQDAIGKVGEQVTDGLMTPGEADRYYRGGTL